MSCPNCSCASCVSHQTNIMNQLSQAQMHQQQQQQQQQQYAPHMAQFAASQQNMAQALGLSGLMSQLSGPQYQQMYGQLLQQQRVYIQKLCPECNEQLITHHWTDANGQWFCECQWCGEEYTYDGHKWERID